VQYGSETSGYPAWLSFFRHVVKLPLNYSKWDSYEQLAHYNLRVLHPDFCLVVARPVELHQDSEHRPHADHGPFCRWADGSAYYAVHGVRVPWWLIEQPKRLTVARIQSETNAEVRRVMLERYGFDRYLSDSGALPIHADECGTLYRTDLADDEPLVVVRVQNSTSEADGSFKHYSLRVPPSMTTARAAIAWTFGQTAETYRPAVET
jgi:hypothetical protein